MWQNETDSVGFLRACHQISISSDDIVNIVTITVFGKSKFLRMPFGLKNVLQTFQQFMDEVTKGLVFVSTFKDHVLIASSSLRDILVI